VRRCGAFKKMNAGERRGPSQTLGTFNGMNAN